MSDRLKRWPEQMNLGQATIFSFPAGIANLMLTCSVLCVSMFCLLLYLQLFHAEPGPVWPVLLAFSLLILGTIYTFRSFLRCRDRIAVNEDGISYLSRYAKPIYLPWDQVISIDVHESQQRLVLGNAKHQRISLEYQIEEFSKLREFVLAHATAVQRRYGAGQQAFHRSWYNKCVLIVGAACFLFVASHLARSLGVFAFFFGFGVAALILVFRDPTGVQITKRSIEITYLGWKRSVAFPDVTGIFLEDVPDGKGNVWAAVILERRSDKPVKLFRFREGSIALRDALQSAWKAAGQ